MAEETPQHPIIDSHIHLYPSSEIDTLAWCDSSNPLCSQHSVSEYAAATKSLPSLKGFIFLETDRKHNLELDGSGWEMPLMEVEWLKRIALGTPREGEGHTAAQATLCLGIVPWAPVPCGSAVLERYVQEVERCAGESFSTVKGFRYLLQDKPRGTMLTDAFVDGLKWLGRKGFAFDVGVDQHSRGKWQLEEAALMIERAHEGVEESEKVTFIINHLCKPDLSVYNQTDPSFVSWRTAMFRLSQFPKTYMKLSGCFSEMPASLKSAPIDDIVAALQPYLVIILAAFGSFRIMFGSDWPVFTVGVEDAWGKWRRVVERFCDLASLGTEERIMIWSGTAMKAYGIRELS